MQTQEGIARLKRRNRIAQGASILLGMFGICSVCLYLEPGLLQIPLDQHELYGGKCIWLSVGVGFIFLSCLFYTIATQWTRRLLWIRENVIPVAMRLTLEVVEDSESTDFYARLYPVERSYAPGESGWRMRLWAKPKDIRKHLQGEFMAEVYFDPESGRPAVADFEHGILWSMAGSGSTERIGK